MREKTILPTNIMDWPRVAPLLPEQKLIYLGCWLGGGWMRTCGCGMMPLRPFAASVGLSPEALATGIANLCDKGVELLAYDQETSEVFVMDWFRFHVFRGPVAINIAHRDIQKISSERLKKLIHEKSKGCLPNSNSNGNSNASLKEANANADAVPAAAPEQKFKVRKWHAGVECWFPSDISRVDRLLAEFGEEVMSKAAARVAASCRKILASYVEDEIPNVQRRARAKTELEEPEYQTDSNLQAKGAAMFREVDVAAKIKTQGKLA